MLPILIPLVMGFGLLLLWNNRELQRTFAVVGMAVLFAVNLIILLTVWQDGVLVAVLGGWEAPYGIVLVVDTFSAVMLVIAGLMGLSVAVYSLVTMDEARESNGYYPLLAFLLMGVCGAFSTGDMFNLYVWFEVFLIASFVLIALGGSRAQLEGAVKYLTISLMASAFFLIANGLLYGIVGTLNMADAAQKLQAVEQPGLVNSLAMMYLVAFGIKAGLFPFFFWLPASYHTPPVAVTTIFSALLTKVGVYALIRVFTLLFVGDVIFTHTLILFIAAFTMVTGVLGAVAQMEVRRLLSFHIISQIGYLMMGLGIYTVLSLTGAVFFMVHVIISKSALFMVSGVFYRMRGTYDLKKLGGLYSSDVWLAILFLIPALSLAGIPPFSGFWAKFTLVRAGLEVQQYWIVLAALAVSVLTLFSMMKIWAQAFWKAKPEGATVVAVGGLTGDDRWMLIAPIVLLAVLVVVGGVIAEPVFAVASRAAEQLMDTTIYIDAVLGGGA